MKNDASLYEHHYQHFEDLQMSAQKFYKYIAKVIEKYQYPQVSTGIWSMPIGFLGSGGRREYLVIRWRDLEYLVCAAPFGRSYFISWWFRRDDNNFIFLQRIPILGRLFTPAKPSLFRRDSEVIFIQSIENIVRAEVEWLIAHKSFKVPELGTLEV